MICLEDNFTLKAKQEQCRFPSAIKWSISSNLKRVTEDGYSIEVKAISNGEAFITAIFEGGSEYTKKF